MKIHVEHGDYPENEIILRCQTLDEEMLMILALLRDRSAKLVAYEGNELQLLSPGEVYYAESVDSRTFLYTGEKVLESSQSLASLHAQYEDLGFLRIGKSQLVNLHHVERLKSLPNSRIELTLKNKEKLIVSRHYVQTLKEKLGLN